MTSVVMANLGTNSKITFFVPSTKWGPNTIHDPKMRLKFQYFIRQTTSKTFSLFKATVSNLISPLTVKIRWCRLGTKWIGFWDETIDCWNGSCVRLKFNQTAELTLPNWWNTQQQQSLLLGEVTLTKYSIVSFASTAIVNFDFCWLFFCKNHV